MMSVWLAMVVMPLRAKMAPPSRTTQTSEWRTCGKQGAERVASPRFEPLVCLPASAELLVRVECSKRTVASSPSTKTAPPCLPVLAVRVLWRTNSMPPSTWTAPPSTSADCKRRLTPSAPDPPLPTSVLPTTSTVALLPSSCSAERGLFSSRQPSMVTRPPCTTMAGPLREFRMVMPTRVRGGAPELGADKGGKGGAGRERRRVGEEKGQEQAPRGA